MRVPFELFPEFLPRYQRDLIDDLARYECPPGLLEMLKSKPIPQANVECFRRTALKAMRLKQSPQVKERWQNGPSRKAA